MRPFSALAAIALVLFFGQAALAHTGVGSTNGFTAGLSHPMFGLDHLLAMIAVGLWAAQQGGRALWLVPCTFVSVMALGGLSAHLGLDLPAVEMGIGLSVIVLGLAVAANLKLPVILGMGLVGLFAIFHGHAHGAEMPEDASGLAYGIGFALATALLHGAGIGLAWVASRLTFQRTTQVAGGIITALGVMLLIGN